jgi:hypothetical protein
MYRVPQAGLTLPAVAGRLERGVRQHCATLRGRLKVRRMPCLTVPKQTDAESCAGAELPAAAGSGEQGHGSRQRRQANKLTHKGGCVGGTDSREALRDGALLDEADAWQDTRAWPSKS